jgi:succinate dehydrogenase/fumarate reductase flavoprotein subunit
MLEIALCAQHNNGGLTTDLWWQTNVPGLYAAGEVAGTHGVYRPGGSALNAGQVGSMRAAQHIARFGGEAVTSDVAFEAAAEAAVKKHADLCEKMLSGGDTLKIYSDRATKLMSEVGGAIRNSEKLGFALSEIKDIFDHFDSYVRVSAPVKLYEAYRLRDALISQMTYLAAMKYYVEAGGKSRGSAIYTSKNGNTPAKLGDLFRFEVDSGEFDEVVEEVSYADGLTATVRPVRPLPGDSGFFENVWRRYREDKNVY